MCWEWRWWLSCNVVITIITRAFEDGRARVCEWNQTKHNDIIIFLKREEKRNNGRIKAVPVYIIVCVRTPRRGSWPAAAEVIYEIRFGQRCRGERPLLSSVYFIIHNFFFPRLLCASNVVFFTGFFAPSLFPGRIASARRAHTAFAVSPRSILIRARLRTRLRDSVLAG